MIDTNSQWAITKIIWLGNFQGGPSHHLEMSVLLKHTDPAALCIRTRYCHFQRKCENKSYNIWSFFPKKSVRSNFFFFFFVSFFPFFPKEKCEEQIFTASFSFVFFPFFSEEKCEEQREWHCIGPKGEQMKTFQTQTKGWKQTKICNVIAQKQIKGWNK